MTLNAPYSWIKAFLKTEAPEKDFAKQTSLVGNEVEHRIPADKYLNGVVVGRVLELNPHPNADKLKLATTEIRPGEKVQIVCGGVNLAVNQVVAVALPGARVVWHGDEEVELKETKIRGESSFGMICAAEELGYSGLADGENIWDLSSIIPDVASGTPLSEALELDDTVFVFEMTTNRPDGVSVLGQAREGYAAMLGELDDPMLKVPELPSFDGSANFEFSVEVHEHDLCPRYMGLMLDVKVGPSPWWMQRRLLLAGAKPINNVVDVTNYVRLEYGQPLHTFDYDKIEGGKIIVRRAKEGEKFVALDETEHELTSDMLAIADASKPVAVGGVMGGLESGVTESTTRVILEAASFEPVSIRNTWRKLCLQSDSQALYEKGLSSELPAYGMARAVELLKEVASARVVSKVHDMRAGEYRPLRYTLDPIKVNELIGVEIDTNTQVEMLRRLGFKVEDKAGEVNKFDVEVPFWRDHDIEHDVDLAEEIARLYGYENLPVILPEGEIPVRTPDPDMARAEELKDLLSGFGWTEVYSNSFNDPEDVKRCLLKVEDHLVVKNPLGIDQSLMRTSLWPNVLRALADNQMHPTAAKMFELGNVYLPRTGELPYQVDKLLVAVMSDKGGEDLFREAKGVLNKICGRYHVRYELNRSGVPSQVHPGRSAVIEVAGEAIGAIGELHPVISKAFDLDRAVALVDIDLHKLAPHMRLSPRYKEPSDMQPAYRDLAMLVDEAVEYVELENTMKSSAGLLRGIELFDLYRGKQIEAGKKSVAVHLTFTADDRTLTSEEVDGDMQKIVQALTQRHNATIRE